MLHRSLITPHNAEAAAAHTPMKPAHILERQAAYSHSSTLGWVHWHKEMNYRKKPLGMQAFSPKHMDPWAPMAIGFPFRHVETSRPGQWFGAGHYHPMHYGRLNWKVACKTYIFSYGGIVVALVTYVKRMAVNGWAVQNANAVSGAT